MAFVTADRVKDSSTTTGTGSFTVSGTAPSGYRTLDAVLATSDTFYYAIVNTGADEWEVGLGTYSGSHVFARTTPLASTNSNNAVNFSAGSKDVWIDFPAARMYQQNGTDVAIADGGTGASTAATALANLGGISMGKAIAAAIVFG
jgi:hypothetical protein